MTLHERDGRDGVPPGFLELPALVYRDDPEWVPEDAEAVSAAFSDRNSYFPTCAARTYCIPGQARAAAFFDPALHISGEPVAYFGYFESTGDQDAAAAVLRAVEGWARERGARTLYGPIQFNTFTGYRLRLSVEPGGLPFGGEPYNPPGYPALLEALGMAVHQRYVTQLVPLSQVMSRLEPVRALRDALVAQGYRFELVTPENWLGRLPQIYEMADTTFQHNFGYTRPSYDSFAAAFGASLLRRMCQVSSILVLGPQGDPAAFGLGFPHYGALTVQARGAGRVASRDLDFQQHRPLLEAYPPRGIIAKTLGVHPNHRRKGLLEGMLYDAFERVVGHGLYDLWYAALIREDNFSRRVFASVHTGERHYALYSKTLEDPR